MSQTLVIGINLGAGLAGQAANLRAQIYDTAHSAVGGLISSGFTETGTKGTYQWTNAFSDAFAAAGGSVDFSISGTVWSTLGLNPSDFGLVTTAAAVGTHTYYVTKTGNDTTGDGSRANPWLTISKAYLAAASGDTIKVGDGTYAENTSASGYFQIARTFTDWVTIESESGAAAAVIITGASNATFNTYTNATANAYLRLRNLTFGARLSTNASAIRVDRTDRMEIINCYAVAPTDSTGTKFAMHLVTSGAMAINNLTVDGGVYSGAVSNSHGIFGQGVSGAGTISNITFRNVWSDGILGALSLSGDVANFLVDGGRYVSTGNAGISLGLNSATSAGTLTGRLTGFVLDQSGSAGIALLIGAGCVGVVVEGGFDIRAGNYGVEVRGNITVPNTGTILRDGTIRGGGNTAAGSGSAVYWRGVTAGRVERCQLSKRTGVNGVVQVGADGTAAGTITCVDNTIISYGGLALEWGTAGAAGDSGGSIVDRNIYDLRGPAATLGSVYGTTGLLTMGALRAAWATYSVTTNDAKSTMAPASAEYYTANRAAALDTLGRVLYVRKSGNDTSGDGSSGAPYLTLSKAQAQAIDGDTIRIGDGIYQEDTASQGYFQLNRLFGHYVTFESESGDPASVIIQGASHATFNVLTSGATGYYRFRNVSFTPRLTTNTSAFRISRGDHFELVNCRLTAPSASASPTKFAIHLANSPAGAAISNITFEDCIWNAEPNANAHGCFVLAALLTSSLITNLRFINCQGSGHLSALTIDDTVTGIEIDGGVYLSTGSYGIRIGQDDEDALAPQTGTIKNARISTEFGTGHGLLLGCGSDNMTAENCDVLGADYAIVVKESDGHVITRCRARGGIVSSTNGSAIYFKGSRSCTVEESTLTTDKGNQATVQVGIGDGGRQVQNISVVDNLIIAMGVRALDWGDSTEDLGGGLCDRNLYDVRGQNGTIGSVRTTSGITSIAALRAAWDSYGAGTNDERSELMIDHTPGAQVTATIDTAAIADAVWDELTAGHTTAGSFGAAIAGIPAAVWSYVTRTVTMAAAALQAAISGSVITLRRGDTNSVSITGLGNITARTKLWFTVKENVSDADTASLIQIIEGTGLVVLNGDTGVAGQGALVVTNATTGAVTITLAAAAAAQLELQANLYYDIQVLQAGVVSTLTDGALKVAQDVTRAVS